jgi:hypothetical protein
VHEDRRPSSSSSSAAAAIGDANEHEQITFGQWLQMFLPSTYCPSSPLCALETVGTEAEVRGRVEILGSIAILKN